MFFFSVVSSPRKGLRYLVRAWKEIDTDKKLVIAGGASDTQAFINELKAICVGDDRIIFTGFQSGKSVGGTLQ